MYAAFTLEPAERGDTCVTSRWCRAPAHLRAGARTFTTTPRACHAW